ncbi:MAG: dihydroorotate dehydrogenase [Candidatus Scalindua sp. AMX11]|nr:MAG: dihydroorotate dehydrogenase [Candidatus Scalindua sp.]RZV77589.1 MAG: dihydroorotate dehydrogenase [Candidatus Scalindua sp. SCAELEC01]TDE63105.1 MAG: dihydroorotate dehydrogenase [Candidatus Scalindua sp. AMX11]GJQ58659.1 MAG: dihydroorotate dehydrogenase B catalytic subunit [Candidatus Scalindua sp.]
MLRPNLITNLCGIKLPNPTILPSGFLGTSRPLLKRVADNGAGAVTIKSVGLTPREGHKNPTVVTFEAGMLNAVGYSNPGVEEIAREFSETKEIDVPLIASVIGTDADEFVRVIEKLSDTQFSAIELPLSCPHTPGFGLLAGQGTPENTREIVSAVRKATQLPIFVKLSPNIPGIGNLAKVAEDAGADAITAVNSLGPGMIINIEARSPVLSFKIGGVTGSALRPIATRCVYDIYEAVDIPIIGVGGISTGRHAIEMIMAGATAIGIGTGIYQRGIGIFRKVCDEMETWMSENNLKSIDEIRGVAHG